MRRVSISLLTVSVLFSTISCRGCIKGHNTPIVERAEQQTGYQAAVCVSNHKTGYDQKIPALMSFVNLERMTLNVKYSISLEFVREKADGRWFCTLLPTSAFVSGVATRFTIIFNEPPDRPLRVYYFEPMMHSGLPASNTKLAHLPINASMEVRSQGHNYDFALLAFDGDTPVGVVTTKLEPKDHRADKTGYSVFWPLFH